MDPRSWNDETPALGNRYYAPYRDDDEPDRRPGRSRSVMAVCVSFALVIVVGTVGWLLLRPGPGPAGGLASDTGTGTSDPSGGSAAVTVTTPPPTATPKPTPKPKPSKTTAKPRVTPTTKPPKNQLPPPPPPPVTEQPSCEKHPGPDATKSEVSSALASAGGQDYWARDGVNPPQGATLPLPSFSVPARLMDAIAFTESSWRSTVVACDGGIGLMQIMATNVTFLNDRFNANFDVHTLDGNARLGAAYLEWLTCYFGTYYFGTYDLGATAAVGTGGTTLRLEDVVIAAYNVGYGQVEDLHGTADGSDDTLSIPNSGYVDKVLQYYTDQPWLSL